MNRAPYHRATNALSKSIMRRVYAVWFFRALLSPGLVKLYAITFLSWEFLSRVSLGYILVNAPGLDEFSKNIGFFSRAFLATEMSIQLIVLSGAVLVALMLRDAVLPRPKAVRGFLRV